MSHARIYGTKMVLIDGEIHESMRRFGTFEDMT